MRPVREWSAYLGVLLLLSALTYARVIGAIDSKVFAQNDDSSLFIFWLAHHADVIAGWFGQGSGERNFLYTTSMNSPVGVNGAWNTSMLGLGIVLAPITWLLGPIAAYNVAVIASPIACALAAAAAMSQLVRRPWAFAGGIAYGFSSFVVSQSAGHINLSFAVLPALMVLTVTRLLQGRGRWWRNGLGLGLAVGWQFYLSTELLAGTFIAFIVFIAALAVCDLGVLRAGSGRVLKGGVLGAGAALAIGAPVFVTMLTMPGHPRSAIRPHGIWNADLLEAIVPGPFTAFGPGHGLESRGYSIDPAEEGVYLGIVWVALSAATVLSGFLNRRYGGLIRTAGLAAASVFILSMGAPWRVEGEVMAESTPWSFVEKMPIFEHVLPMRLIVHATLALSVLLAVALELASRSSKTWVRLGAFAAAGLSVILVTSGTVEPRDAVVADFYRSGEFRAYIESGATVKMMPGPVASASPHTNESLVNQAVTGMWFRQTGGYFIGATDERDVVYQAEDDALDRAMRDSGETTLPGREELSSALEELSAQGVDYIAITDGGNGLTLPAEDIAQRIAEAGVANFWHVGGVYLLELQ